MAVAKEFVNNDPGETKWTKKVDSPLVILEEIFCSLAVEVRRSPFLNTLSQWHPVHIVVLCPKKLVWHALLFQAMFSAMITLRVFSSGSQSHNLLSDLATDNIKVTIDIELGDPFLRRQCPFPLGRIFLCFGYGRKER